MSYQGKTVIEASPDGFLVMHPDGAVVIALTTARAERVAKKWYKDHLGPAGVGIGEIEWRL